MFVAGAIGPTNRTASLSPDVNDPSLRNVTFDDLVESYYQQILGLVEGGVDILMPETTFDTLNLKAAIFAIENFFDSSGKRLPVILSITITDASGRTLSGQTTEACWNSIAHAKPLGVGLNCALGADAMRPYLQALSKTRIVLFIAILTPDYRILLPQPDMMKNLRTQPARFLPLQMKAYLIWQAAVAVQLRSIYMPSLKNFLKQHPEKSRLRTRH